MACAEPSTTSADSELDVAVKTVFGEIREKYKVPGVVILTLKNGALDKQWALGQSTPSDSMSLETIFEAASLSKTLLAYLAHQFVAEGQLELDESLTSYLPADSLSAMAEPHRISWLLDEENPDLAGRLTARQLLNHTAGYRGREQNGRPILEGEPGANFYYAEDGYLLLQRTIEYLTDSTLQQLAQVRIFAPLGMDNSSFLWRPDFEGRTAMGYNYAGEVDRLIKRPVRALANGTLLTSGPDFTRFLSSLLSDTALLTQFQLQSVAVANSFPALRWGTGIGIETTDQGRLLWQWGSNWVYRAYFAIDPATGDGLVVFTNGIRGYKIFEPLSSLLLGRPLQGVQWAGWL
jgi:CubicO group peptidase (beta-lactamase class C family)